MRFGILTFGNSSGIYQPRSSFTGRWLVVAVTIWYAWKQRPEQTKRPFGVGIKSPQGKKERTSNEILTDAILLDFAAVFRSNGVLLERNLTCLGDFDVSDSYCIRLKMNLVMWFVWIVCVRMNLRTTIKLWLQFCKYRLIYILLLIS